MVRRRFNAIGAGLTLASTATPWYMASSCGQFLAFWLFNLPQPQWLVLVSLIAGGILSLFSRYGGLLTMGTSLFFAATFTTGQLSLTHVSPPGIVTTPCPTDFYGTNGPTALHELGVWIALAGGILTVALGKSWTLVPGISFRQSSTDIVRH